MTTDDLWGQEYDQDWGSAYASFVISTPCEMTLQEVKRKLLN